MIPLGVLAAASPRAIAGGDPHWAKVASLLHFDGADGSTTFTDQRSRVWTPAGSAQIDTAFSKFGGASGLFVAPGSYISTPHDSALAADGDFTVEAWCRPLELGRHMTIACKRPSGVGEADWWLHLLGTTNRFRIVTWGPSGSTACEGLTVATVGTWYHVAAAKQGTTWRLFVNGVLESTDPEPSYTPGGSALYVGRDPSASGTAGSTRDWNGSIDDFRITKGIARYTSDFTPPAAAFPNF